MAIDTGNYYPRQRDGRIAEIEQGMTESRWVSTRLGRPVVKAFKRDGHAAGGRVGLRDAGSGADLDYWAGETG